MVGLGTVLRGLSVVVVGWLRDVGTVFRQPIGDETADSQPNCVIGSDGGGIEGVLCCIHGLLLRQYFFICVTWGSK